VQAVHVGRGHSDALGPPVSRARPPTLPPASVRRLRTMSALDRALYSLGAADSRDGGPAPAVVAKAPERALTKKEQAAMEEKKKLERLKKKAAASLMGGEKDKKDAAKKEKVAAKKEKEAAKKEEEAVSSVAAPAPGDAAALAAGAPSAAPPKAASKAPSKYAVARAISAEERRRAMEAERQRAEEAEAAFAAALGASVETATSLETVPMDYVVRTAEELDEARRAAALAGEERERVMVAEKLKAVVRAAVAKKGCEVSMEEWGLLRLVTAAAA